LGVQSYKKTKDEEREKNGYNMFAGSCKRWFKRVDNRKNGAKLMKQKLYE